MSDTELLDHLSEVLDDFVGSIRFTEFPDQKLVERLYDLLRQCSRQWHTRTEIPKRLAIMLLGLPAVLLENVSNYSAEEQEELMEIYREIDMSIVNIVSA